MKTKTIEIYSLDELTERAQRNAYQNWLNKGYGVNHWQHENRQALDKFFEHFPCGVSRRGNYEFTESEQIANLSGVRLATYLWNNYKIILFKGKYFGNLKNGQKETRHPRIESQWLKDVERYFKPYHSAIILETSCVLTGYWIDDEILKPIYDFLKKPDSTDFKQLLYECFQSWEQACERDDEHQSSFEAFKDDCAANEFEFLENGEFA